jgi:hypothetical protein
MGPLKPKQNHKAIGEQSEAIIMAKLLEVGYSVLMNCNMGEGGGDRTLDLGLKRSSLYH